MGQSFENLSNINYIEHAVSIITPHNTTRIGVVVILGMYVSRKTMPVDIFTITVGTY